MNIKEYAGRYWKSTLGAFYYSNYIPEVKELYGDKYKIETYEKNLFDEYEINLDKNEKKLIKMNNGEIFWVLTLIQVTLVFQKKCL